MSSKPIDDPSYPVRKTDAEWRAQLDPMQYQVARHAATERAFSGRYWDHFAAGQYRCIGCGEPLFDAGTKFDAGCGWPSYSATRATACCASKCAVPVAAPTWAMCSTTARRPPASVSASIRPR